MDRPSCIVSRLSLSLMSVYFAPLPSMHPSLYSPQVAGCVALHGHWMALHTQNRRVSLLTVPHLAEHYMSCAWGRMSPLWEIHYVSVLQSDLNIDTHTHSCTCITYRSVIYITLSAINWLYNLKRTLNKVCISFQLLKSTVLIQISHHTVLLAWIQILTERKKPQCQQYVCNKRQRTGLTVNHLYLCWCAFTVLFLFFQLCVCLSQVLFGV